LIDTQINAINDMVNKQTEYTWDLNLVDKRYPLNMTMTKSPDLAKDSHLIKLNFDGTFHKQGGHLVPYTHDYFPDMTGTHREQLWIHQNTFNTLVASAAEYYKNFEMSSPDLDMYLPEIIPELEQVCGGTCSFTFTITPEKVDSMISLTMADGIQIGGKDSMFNIEITAMNKTNGAPMSVMTFETAMLMKVNFTMSNVIFYPVYQQSMFWNTNLTKSAVTIAPHKYDKVLGSMTKVMG